MPRTLSLETRRRPFGIALLSVALARLVAVHVDHASTLKSALAEPEDALEPMDVVSILAKNPRGARFGVPERTWRIRRLLSRKFKRTPENLPHLVYAHRDTYAIELFLLETGSCPRWLLHACDRETEDRKEYEKCSNLSVTHTKAREHAG